MNKPLSFNPCFAGCSSGSRNLSLSSVFQTNIRNLQLCTFQFSRCQRTLFYMIFYSFPKNYFAVSQQIKQLNSMSSNKLLPVKLFCTNISVSAPDTSLFVFCCLWKKVVFNYIDDFVTNLPDFQFGLFIYRYFN